jgi:hypothetical protein
LERYFHQIQIGHSRDGAILNRDSSVLIWIGSSLSRETIVLIIHQFPGEEIAVLKHRRRVAEDTINCVVNNAFPVELCVNSVLVTFEAAAVEC